MCIECIECIERVVVGDEEHCLVSGDCNKRLSFVDKCRNEIEYAKERIDYFMNNKNAKDIWNLMERNEKITFWTEDHDFWVKLLNEGDK